MDLSLNSDAASGYTNNAQRTRIVTENWVQSNVYCPNCGHAALTPFPNNSPVADFLCKMCREEFELKSKAGRFSRTITDGAYETMLRRITSRNNPNLFLLTYSPNWKVTDFLVVPRHFFIPEIIIQRKPLSSSAKRAGWVGCNIAISRISEVGKIALVVNGHVIDEERVRMEFHRTLFLRNLRDNAKGWIFDVLHCLEKIKKEDFTLGEIYSFEKSLAIKHPQNRHIREKIRQQLQLLRGCGLLEFLGDGRYKKKF